MSAGQRPILELQGITKSFGGVEALRGVDFALLPGEIHGLVGENGAGKSTLMKIIAGVHTEFSGRVLIDGQETHFRSARDAHAAGIAMVHQELSVAPDLTVAENVFLGNQPINRLGLVTCRTFETPAANTIPVFAQDPSYIAEIYGREAIELVLPEDKPDAKILDILEQPDRYAGIVRRIREHLAGKHSYETRLTELIEMVRS